MLSVPETVSPYFWISLITLVFTELNIELYQLNQCQVKLGWILSLRRQWPRRLGRTCASVGCHKHQVALLVSHLPSGLGRWHFCFEQARSPCSATLTLCPRPQSTPELPPRSICRLMTFLHWGENYIWSLGFHGLDWGKRIKDIFFGLLFISSLMTDDWWLWHQCINKCKCKRVVKKRKVYLLDIDNESCTSHLSLYRA